MKIKVIRLFSSAKELEEFKYCFVAHMKRPHALKNVDMGNGQGKTIVDSWQHYVRINLWLIEFNFDWITCKN